VQNGAITVDIQNFCNVHFVENLILNMLLVFDYSDVTGVNVVGFIAEKKGIGAASARMIQNCNRSTV